MASIALNKETLGLVVACFSIIGTGVGVYNWMLSGRAENAPIVKSLAESVQELTKAQALKDAEQDNRLDRTDRDRTRNTEALKEQTVETQSLKEAVVKLTAVIENSPTRKAEYYFENLQPKIPTVEVRR